MQTVIVNALPGRGNHPIWVEVTIEPSEFGWRLQAKRVEDVPVEQTSDESHPELRRLGAAVSWIATVDAVAKEKLLTGDVIVKEVPRRALAPLPTLPARANAETYQQLRLSAGQLIRPLFLSSPDLAPLFPYQRQGVEWLLRHPVGILADDMGLGKTLEAISAARLLVWNGEAQRILVVAPRSLLANWEDELTRWAPELARLRVTPTPTHREEAWNSILDRVHVMLTNYEQLRTIPQTLAAESLDLIIADEAHRIRNLEAAITRGARNLRRRRFWALTGTPIERDPRDLATLLSTLDPARFSPRDSQAEPAVLRSRARPYTLRRMKGDVLDELPDVIDSKETLELLPLQWQAYRRACRDVGRKAGSAAMLVLINELRTICDYDPATGASCKTDRIAEIIGNIATAGEKAVIFSHLLRPLDLLKERLERFGMQSARLQGSMSLPEREAAIRSFKNAPTIPALLASSRVGGEGLNLTEANHVVFVNEWWNPSANAQARDRVVRIGQRRGVRVYRFRCRGTIEETLDHILEQKTHAFVSIIDRLADPAASEDPNIRQLLKELEFDLLPKARAKNRPSDGNEPSG